MTSLSISDRCVSLMGAAFGLRYGVFLAAVAMLISGGEWNNAYAAQQGVKPHERHTVISGELEQALHDSFVRAREKRHKWITVEHLLLRLLDLPSIQER